MLLYFLAFIYKLLQA